MAALEETNPSIYARVQAQQSIDEILHTPTTPSSAKDYPPVSSIPRTSRNRLAQASPDYHGPKSASTVLYLAYGSNLSAHTFLGQRGIRPISAINVSAPAFDLSFDLPGFPYREPCFANIAPRKVPNLPLPGDPPTKPPINLPPSYSTTYGEEKEKSEAEEEKSYLNSSRSDSIIALPALPIRRPTWNRGLYGVVYEVTAEDYRKIVATEGGGASYTDVAALCIALPPAIHVPEQPPIPDLKPFLAHTLYAPRLPAEPKPPADNWWQKFLLPVRRQEADYAQPSLRYLRLIREGAAEHFLPLEYQEYLQKLETYAITRRSQEIGKWLFTLLWAPLFLLFLALSKVFVSKEDGKLPKWLAVAASVQFNLIWVSYDSFFKDRFGDGERTMEDEEEDNRSVTRKYWVREKNRLLDDW